MYLSFYVDQIKVQRHVNWPHATLFFILAKKFVNNMGFL